MTPVFAKPMLVLISVLDLGVNYYEASFYYVKKVILMYIGGELSGVREICVAVIS